MQHNNRHQKRALQVLGSKQVARVGGRYKIAIREIR